MKRTAMIVAALTLAACSSENKSTPSDLAVPDPLTITTDKGVVSGKASGSTRLFLGIPYAAPPVAALRWKSPQPADAWTTPLDATAFGPHCPQFSIIGNAYDTAANEDCLTLNVWTPSDTTVKHPVMVWLYGGGFVLGASDDPMYEGTLLSSAGEVVVVSLNYRLGPLGFLAHSALTAEDPAHPGSGDWGLEDQRAALKWVQTNIAAFGGDPDNVTLFGESAGAISTCMHAISAPSAGLFHHVLMESGTCVVSPTQADAEAQGDQFSTALGCTGDDVLGCMRGRTAEQVLTALPLKSGFFFGAGVAWQPVVDNINLTEQPAAAIAGGALAKTPALFGTNKDEGTLFVKLAGLQITSEADYESTVGAIFGAADTAAIVAEYPEANYASYNDALSDLLGDGLFVCPARGLAEAYALLGQPIYLYSFRHAITTILGDLGAFHSSELGFVFGNGWTGTPLTTDEIPLSMAMQGYWTRFAAVGDPNGASAVDWPLYAVATDENLDLDLTITSGANLKKTQCDFWATITP